MGKRCNLIDPKLKIRIGQHVLINKNWEIDVFPVPDNEMSLQDAYIAYPKGGEDDPAITWVCAEIEAAYGFWWLGKGTSLVLTTGIYP